MEKTAIIYICVDDFVQKSLVLHCSHSAGRHCYCCLAEQLDVCWNDAFPHFLFQLLGEAAQFLPQAALALRSTACSTKGLIVLINAGIAAWTESKAGDALEALLPLH